MTASSGASSTATATATAPTQSHSAALPASWHLASGAISGAASVLILQPLDLIKTRIQQPQSHTTVVAPTPTRPGGRLSVPPGIWSTTRRVVAQDGLTGLWRGTTPTLYRNVPGVSMYFLTLSKFRTLAGTIPFFQASPPSTTTTTMNPIPTGNRQRGGGGGGQARKVKLTTTGDLLVGSTARTGVGFLLMPFTLMKTISESTLSLRNDSASRTTTTTSGTIQQPSRRSTTVQTLEALYKQGGVRSLWRGAVPTALRDAPGAGLFVVFYERVRRVLGQTPGGDAVGGGTAGAVASLLSTLLTTPFDLLKTRRQLSPNVYTTLVGSAKLVYRQNGLRGFWEGGGLRVVRKAGSAGIGWAVYEGFLGVGERRRTESEEEAERVRSGGG